MRSLQFFVEGRRPTPLQAIRQIRQQETKVHRCAYRVLARMAKEPRASRSITHCHYEGALLEEGQFSPRRATHQNRRPEFFTVVSDATSHASLAFRGEFVLNKVHGCVHTWRHQLLTDETWAAEAIIIRWSQALEHRLR